MMIHLSSISRILVDFEAKLLSSFLNNQSLEDLRDEQRYPTVQKEEVEIFADVAYPYFYQEIISSSDIEYDPKLDGTSGECLFINSYPTNQYPNSAPESRRVEIPETTTIDHVTKETEEVEEASEESNQSRPSVSAPENTSRSVATENSAVGIDWDSEESWDRRFVRIITNDRKERQQEFQLLEEQRDFLAIERHNLDQISQHIDRRENDLRMREAKIKEVEDLIPSAKELRSAGITFKTLIPYIMACHERSVMLNVDLKTAAYDIIDIIRAYQDLTSLHNAAEIAKQQIANLDALCQGKQTAVTTLMNLQMAGFSDEQIHDLVVLVSQWNGQLPGMNTSIQNDSNNGHNSGRKLDTKLISLGN
jgi:hypothetical protein